MASYRDWPDGKAHSIPYAQHLANMRARAGNPLSLPAPPVGTYDPSIDYNANAANRGWQQAQNDAATQYEQGQQDYGLNLVSLNTNRDRNYADLGTNETRLNEDYGRSTAETQRQYGILGRQQMQSAARQGVTSGGLLAKSAAVRGENQGRDQSALDQSRDRGLADIGTQRSRVGEDYTSAKTQLDLGNARAFGGYGGNSILNPLTGKPEFGSLLTNLTRAGAENNAYQTAAGQQRAAGAQSMGYVSPLLSNTQQGGTVGLGGAAVTGQQYQSGLLLEALLRASAKNQGKTYEEVKRGAGL